MRISADRDATLRSCGCRGTNGHGKADVFIVESGGGRVIADRGILLPHSRRCRADSGIIIAVRFRMEATSKVIGSSARLGVVWTITTIRDVVAIAVDKALIRRSRGTSEDSCRKRQCGGRGLKELRHFDNSSLGRRGKVRHLHASARKLCFAGRD